MKKKISFSLSDREFNEIKTLAKKNNLSVTELILRNLPIKSSEELKISLEDVLRKLPDVTGEVFSIDKLFEEQKWNAYTKGSRIAVGKAFKKLVDTAGKKLRVKYLWKNSANLAFYEKI